MKTTFIFILAVLLAVATGQGGCPVYEVRTVTAAAPNARRLTRTVNRFRRALGDPDNLSMPGSQRVGRREINWDNPALPFMLPGNFFNTNAPRGLVMRTRGGQFRVSNSNNPRDDRFNSILPSSVSNQFQFFSRNRLFTPYSSNRFVGIFQIPGRNRPAAVSGFGAVFVDVDRSRTTYIDFFDRAGCLIERLFVPPRNRGLSFAGLTVRGRGGLLPAIYRIRVKLGDISVRDFSRRYQGTSVGDVVVMDDFLYGEPQ